MKEILFTLVMVIKIQNSGKDGVSNTKGSCGALVNYLNHEDNPREEEGKMVAPFMTATGVKVSKEEVIDKIDRNHYHLTKETDKFFHIVIAPSVDEISIMGETEEERFRSMCDYVQAALELYAESFHRDKLTGDKLLAFYKIHFERGESEEEELHAHIVVSRNTQEIDGRILKISPLTPIRREGKGAVKSGFDRKGFYLKCEKTFDEKMGYNRSVEESFAYKNAQAHGTPEEKAEQARLLAKEKMDGVKEQLSEGLAKRQEAKKRNCELTALAEALRKQKDSEQSQEAEHTVSAAIESADLANKIIAVFREQQILANLNLELMMQGIAVQQKKSVDGLEAVGFVKQGILIPAKDLFPEKIANDILKQWGILTGQKLALVTRRERAAEMQAEREEQAKEQISQVTRKLKIRH